MCIWADIGGGAENNYILKWELQCSLVQWLSFLQLLNLDLSLLNNLLIFGEHVRVLVLYYNVQFEWRFEGNCCKKPCRSKVLVWFVDSSFVERPLFNEFVDFLEVLMMLILICWNLWRLTAWSRLIGLPSLMVNGFPRPKNEFVFVLVQWNNIRIGDWNNIKISF